MSPLSDELRALGVKLGVQELKPPEPKHPFAVEKVLSGRLHETACGTVFVVEKTLPVGTPHGCRTLRIDTPLTRLVTWTSAPGPCKGHPQRICFLDIETTGLGGAGCYAFMVGIAHYEEEQVRLTQLFMRNPGEEVALLTTLADLVQPCEELVTFNGRGFDVPLLEGRYRLNRISPPFSTLAHLDLLPVARRLWRERLTSRALRSLETHILGLPRDDWDVPGWLIPQMYVEYLHSGDARPLKGVFYHNETDVLSMVALLGLIAEQLNNPFDSTTHPLDLVAMGQMHEASGETEQAINLYRQGIARGLPAEAHQKTVERLALLHKRRGEWAQAVALWEQAARSGQIYACVELAKYYEHHKRDYDQAIHWTCVAMTHIQSPEFPRHERFHTLAELEHRLNRLQLKLSDK